MANIKLAGGLQSGCVSACHTVSSRPHMNDPRTCLSHAAISRVLYQHQESWCLVSSIKSIYIVLITFTPLYQHQESWCQVSSPFTLSSSPSLSCINIRHPGVKYHVHLPGPHHIHSLVSTLGIKYQVSSHSLSCLAAYCNAWDTSKGKETTYVDDIC